LLEGKGEDGAGDRDEVDVEGEEGGRGKGGNGGRGKGGWFFLGDMAGLYDGGGVLAFFSTTER